MRDFIGIVTEARITGVVNFADVTVAHYAGHFRAEQRALRASFLRPFRSLFKPTAVIVGLKERTDELAF